MTEGDEIGVSRQHKSFSWVKDATEGNNRQNLIVLIA